MFFLIESNRLPKIFQRVKKVLLLFLVAFLVSGFYIQMSSATTNQKEIDRLLKLGDSHFRNWRYTSPVGDEQNALSVYNKVLKLDPENSIAKKQIKKMEAYYLRKVKQMKNNGNESKLKYYYKKVLLINPENKSAIEALGLKPEPKATETPILPTPVPIPKLSKAEQLQKQRYSNYSDEILNKLKEANAAYASRTADDKSQVSIRKAIRIFKEVLKIDPNNYDALWQIARSILWLGDHVSEDKKIEIFTSGMKFAKKAISINHNGIEAHYWHGSNMGKYGAARGIFKSLQYIDPIIKEMQTVLKLDPQHHKATTVLGIIYRKAPPWPVSVGDIQKSVEYLRRSISQNPKSLYAHLEMGITYNKLKKWTEAKREFQWVIKAPYEKEYKPENIAYKEEAREILMMIKRRGY